MIKLLLSAALLMCSLHVAATGSKVLATGGATSIEGAAGVASCLGP